jgi:hypothetical protein
MPAVGMYRHFAFEAIGLFDPSLNAAADYDLYLRIAKRFPAHLHDTLVAEYRQHGANMTRDPARMLRSTIQALRKQKQYTKRDDRYWEAHKTGIRAWQSWYGVPLAEEVRRGLKEGRWREAASGAWTLSRYYPGGLALVPNGRYWAVRELEVRERQLRQRNRRIKELNSALNKERREVQRLRKEGRHSELQAQNVKRELQEIQDSETWKLVLRLSKLRSRLKMRGD